MGEARVGIIGASGAVGRIVARELHALGRATLRLGGRAMPALYEIAAELGRGVEVMTVDVRDERALAVYCQGCQLIVNCAGPSFLILDRVARGALAAGADYLDLGGDEPVRDRLVDLDPGPRVVLLTAGMMPGLSAILVRWLAERFDAPQDLLAYVGGRDRMSPASAVDYVLSLRQSSDSALASWSGHRKVARGLAPLSDVVLAHFPPCVTAYPYLSGEAERLGRSLGLAEIRWYNVFEGEHMLRALRRLQGAALNQADVEDAAADLAKAAELDLFGFAEHQIFLLRMKGAIGGRIAERMVKLVATNARTLTAHVAALASLAVLEGKVAPGIHFAGEVLSTDIVERLRQGNAIAALVSGELEGEPEAGHEGAGATDAAEALEEGEL